MEKEMKVVDFARVKKSGIENIAYLTKRPHLLVPDEKNGFIHANGQKLSPSHALETKRSI
ncbi:hypothetical protein [Paenibacillus lutimineralis]|uniref:hypothetical protein n=1 Tax=Paenibacillus lutimineralis TaxID=2707005 RepID=UPI001D05224C|nr:hypothetical protein [Paenibacillus lutimineralis]